MVTMVDQAPEVPVRLLDTTNLADRPQDPVPVYLTKTRAALAQSPEEQFAQLSELITAASIEESGLNPLENWSGEIRVTQGEESFVERLVDQVQNAGPQKDSVIDQLRIQAEQFAYTNNQTKGKLAQQGLVPDKFDQVPQGIRDKFSGALNNGDRKTLDRLGRIYPVSFDLLRAEAARQIRTKLAPDESNLEEARSKLVTMPGFERSSSGVVVTNPSWRIDPPVS